MSTPDVREAEVLLDPPAAARLLGVSRQTLARWRCTGFGPLHIKCGTAVRYSPGELRRFIEARTRAHTGVDLGTASVVARP